MGLKRNEELLNIARAIKKEFTCFLWKMVQYNKKKRMAL